MPLGQPLSKIDLGAVLFIDNDHSWRSAPTCVNRDALNGRCALPTAPAHAASQERTHARLVAVAAAHLVGLRALLERGGRRGAPLTMHVPDDCIRRARPRSLHAAARVGRALVGVPASPWCTHGQAHDDQAPRPRRGDDRSALLWVARPRGALVMGVAGRQFIATLSF